MTTKSKRLAGITAIVLTIVGVGYFSVNATYAARIFKEKFNFTGAVQQNMFSLNNHGDTSITSSTDQNQPSQTITTNPNPVPATPASQPATSTQQQTQPTSQPTPVDQVLVSAPTPVVATSTSNNNQTQSAIESSASVPVAVTETPTPATTSISVATNVEQSQVTTPASTPVPSPAPVPTSTQNVPVVVTNTPTTPTQVPTTPSGNNPLAGKSFYLNPYSDAKKQENTWHDSATNAALIDKIASQPTAFWFGGWNSNVTQDVKGVVDQAAAAGTIPVLVAYNIPQRDCGSYSAGGANNPDGYRNWIRSLANGIGSRETVVIVEPDGLANMDCLSANDQTTRLDLISFAVDTLKSLGHTSVYIDAGHPNWINADEMASRLKRATIDHADGFALNVSNFYSDSENVTYGNSLATKLGSKHFVVDTSRNGNGSNNGEWCNSWGRALGDKPTAQTGNSLIDAYLWVKPPGQSDGNCNGGPSAGTWWPDYALDLTRNTKW